jgi:ketosteroid isomerase-like protein
MLRLCFLFVLTFPVVVSASDGAEETDFRQLVASAYVEPFKTGDIDKWIDAFDQEAVAMHNRRPIDRGRGAIETFGRTVHKFFELKEYSVEVTDIRVSADWAYTAGEYITHFVSREDGSAPFGREQGKFMLLWERQPDGRWKIILDTGNSNQ